jgi:two-component system sensor histidine kinase KdpD
VAGRRVAEALKLAEQLGGSSVVLTGDDLPGAALDFARRNNVTQIVIGKSKESRWKVLVGKSLAQALLQRSGGAAVHFVTESAPEAATADAPAKTRGPPRAWLAYPASALLVTAAAGVAALLDRYAAGADLAMIFLASVLLSGLLLGLRPALVAGALAILTYNFFFLEPRFSMAIGHPADVLTFVIFIAVAVVTGWLTGQVRDQAGLVARRASAVTALLASSRRLSAVATRADAAKALSEQISATAGSGAVVFLPAGADIELAAGAPTTPTLSTSALTAARWAWEKGEAAGAGTGTLPQAGWTFRPLTGLRGKAGVAGVEARTALTGDDERLVLALLDQGAVALERAELAATAVETESLRRSDRLRSALMNSISHDLRTPLSTVLGAATTLIDYGKSLKPDIRADLLLSIREEAERLNRYVGDLLDMTRLEGGALAPRTELTDVRDVLGAAADRVARRLSARPLERDFPPELSLVDVDSGLLEQAVVNILENAIAYSPDGARIELAVYEDRANVVISIEDEGKGIPTADLERVFEKFRRVEEHSSDRAGKSVGLGLSISKGFVEAMGGRIAAASPIHGDHGTRVLISLPKARATHHLLL